MSRNFELMQQLQRDPLNSSSSMLDGNGRGTSVPSSDETKRLVQQVFMVPENAPHVVVFAAIDHNNGCSRICGSVAETLSQIAPGAVCLVEANFRSPALAEMMGTNSSAGLTDALLTDGPIRSYAQPVGVSKLWLLSSGPLSIDAPNLLSSERMKSRVAELSREFEYVVIDAPPLARYADGIALGQIADGVVLVLEANTTRREAAQTATSNLRASHVPILGAVLNKRTYPIPEMVYNRL